MEAPPSNERITRSTKLALRLRFLQQAPCLPHTVWIVDTGDTGGASPSRSHPPGFFRFASSIARRSTLQWSFGNASLADSTQLESGWSRLATSAGWGTPMSVESLTYADLSSYKSSLPTNRPLCF